MSFKKISVSQLMNGLNPENDLRITFDDWTREKDNYGKMCTYVRILSVKEVKDKKIVKVYDMIRGSSDTWLNCCGQLNKVEFNVLQKELHCIDIELKMSKGVNYDFHKIKYWPLKQTDGIKRKMAAFNSELSKKRVEYTTMAAKAACDKLDELELSEDDI